MTFVEKNYINGITRKQKNNHFIYYYISNNKSISKLDLERINKLRIPPAWINIWISNDPNTPIQAVGTDTKGRIQYIYSQKHIEKAEKEKFYKMFKFIRAIPKLEKAIKIHEKLGPYEKERVIASMLKIIKEVHMRVGKEIYARKHKTYGVSSLKKIHLKFIRNKIIFRFKGKAGKRLNYTIIDQNLTNHLRLLLKLEGDKLFQYIDESDKIRKVTDTDLNKYIQKYMANKDFSAKFFRTYAANHYFVKALLNETNKRLPKNTKIIKKNILNSLKSVAFYLRHERAVSKKSYVMNFIIDMYQKTPNYFVERKQEDPDDILIDILKLYKTNVLNKH